MAAVIASLDEVYTDLEKDHCNFGAFKAHYDRLVKQLYKRRDDLNAQWHQTEEYSLPFHCSCPETDDGDVCACHYRPVPVSTVQKELSKCTDDIFVFVRLFRENQNKWLNQLRVAHLRDREDEALAQFYFVAKDANDKVLKQNEMVEQRKRQKRIDDLEVYKNKIQECKQMVVCAENMVLVAQREYEDKLREFNL